MPASAINIKSIFPPDVVRTKRILPLSEENGILEIGVEQALNHAALRDLAFLTGKTIIQKPAGEAEVDAFIKQYIPTVKQKDIDYGIEAQAEFDEKGRSRSLMSGSVVQQVDRLIREAIENRASDIHIEPYEHLFRVRYRIDGVLQPMVSLSLLQKDAVIARLKILASLDIAEKRRPQDGRIRFRYGDRTVDLRVSTLPTDFGEKVVLRILDKTSLQMDLTALGLRPHNLHLFQKAIHQPYGMVLVSGPTGSGKTTTLYAALNELNTLGVNITTIEDPIEYNLPGINQTHVRSDIGFSFAKALRAFLRQDPDIVMLGEIRDTETAQIAIRAALTGHLVLSTIHTNDAPSAVTRLVDMGVEPYLVASSVRLVVAQRLLRRICIHCKKEYFPDLTMVNELGLREGKDVLVRGEGCSQCRHSGYQGRLAVFEVMSVGEQMAELIVGRAGIYDLRNQAVSDGMQTLRQEALLMVRTGATSADEVLRETSL